MEHHLGVPVAEHIIHTVRATDIADHRDKVQSLVFLFQFQTEIMHRSLGGVETNQLLNREMSQLATDLATDTAGGSRDKHGLPFQQIADLIQIDMDLLTT